MNELLTIFTPTYNRSYVLKNLYNSLLNQNNYNFIWLIVDDGSTDDTRLLVENWIKEDLINIRYIYQLNQGKHIAHNTGISNCNTELFFCVDSDDYLLNNAVESILEEYKNIKNLKNISGILTIRINRLTKLPIGKTYLPNNIKYASLGDLYEKYKFKGDTSLVFKTSILKQYLFPKIDGEKFIGEEYLYCQLDKYYKLLISDKEYYVCEYLDDGYTKNIFKTIYNNPKGYMELKKMKLSLSKDKSFFVRYKEASLYIVGCFLSKEKSFLRKSSDKFITILAIPLAICIYFVRFTNIKRGLK